MAVSVKLHVTWNSKEQPVLLKLESKNLNYKQNVWQKDSSIRPSRLNFENEHIFTIKEGEEFEVGVNDLFLKGHALDGFYTFKQEKELGISVKVKGIARGVVETKVAPVIEEPQEVKESDVIGQEILEVVNTEETSEETPVETTVEAQAENTDEATDPEPPKKEGAEKTVKKGRKK